MAKPTTVKKPAVLKAYKPSLRERAQIGMEGLYTRATGREPGYAPRRLMGKASELLDFIPGVGDVIGVDETKRALDRRRYLEAGLLGAGTMLGVVPVVGDVAGKVLKGAAKPAQQAVEKLAAKYGTDIPKVRADDLTLPGRDWLSNKQRSVREAQVAAEKAGYAPDAPLGPITGYTERPMLMDPAKVSQFPGAMNEVPKPGNPKYDALMKSMSKKGYDPEQAIVVGVSHQGTPYIIEGNNRAAVARDLGLPAIPVEVRWYTGGERATGALSPDKLADYAYRPAPAARDLAAKYLDPESTRIADWQWRPQEDVKAELGLTEVPPHVVDYGRFMDEQAMRAAKGQMTPRDLLKAYGITRSSMQRKARSLKTAQKYGLELEQLGLEKVRPEGAFSELLGTPEGQAYLDAAQRGQVDDRAIADMMAKFRPYGFQNALGRDLEWGARNLPQRSSEVADMVAAAREGASAPEDWTRFVKDKVTGVDAAKAGFVGAMLGRGDLPTLDAREIILQTGQPTKKATKYLSRKKGEGSVEAVRRLTARMEDLNLALPPELEPYRQHLTHHTVWDKASNEMTTHEDVRNALKNYAGGGLVKKYGL